MARITRVKKAQQRYRTVPVIDPETGQQKVTPVLKKNGQQKTTKTGRPVFLRVTVADKSQPLPNLRCEKCGKEIEPGQPYKHIKPKSGPYGGHQRNRCAACPDWRPSETTSSNIKSIVYAAQEDFEDRIDGCESIDDIKDLLNDVAASYNEAAGAARESASNIEEGFGHSTYQSEELEERADSIESAAQELESWEPDEDPDDIEEVDEDAIKADTADGFVAEEDEDVEEALARAIEEAIAEAQREYEDAVEEALDNARDSARDAVYEIEE